MGGGEKKEGRTRRHYGEKKAPVGCNNSFSRSLLSIRVHNPLRDFAVVAPPDIIQTIVHYLGNHPNR